MLACCVEANGSKEGARPLAEVRHASGMVWKRLGGAEKGEKVEGTKEEKRKREKRYANATP